jgi:hypothetical protein
MRMVGLAIAGWGDSVPEVANAREHHGNAALVGGGNHLVVAH